MKFSINQLLTKYNLVSLLFLLFMGAILIKTFAYKESMNLPKQPKYKYYGDANNITMPPALNVPQCTLFDKNECSINSYCNWNMTSNLCTNIVSCSNFDKNGCKKNSNCSWNQVNNICFYK